MERDDLLEAAAAAAGADVEALSATDITAQQSRLLDLAGRDDAQRWAYETTRNLTDVRSGFVDGALHERCADPAGKIETPAVDANGIPLGCRVRADDDMSVWMQVHLTAEQAEALAVDLLEQALAARAETDG